MSKSPRTPVRSTRRRHRFTPYSRAVVSTPRRTKWASPSLKRRLSKASQSLNDRLGIKRSRTGTRTRTKNMESTTVVKAGPGSNSKYWELHKGPRRAKYRAFGTNVLKFATSSLNTGITAYKAAFSFVYFDYTNTNLMIAKLFNQNPPSMDPTATTATLNQLRPYMLSAKGSFTFTNFSTATVFLDLYDVHPKVSTSANPEIQWSKGDILEEADPSGGSAPVLLMPSSRPSESTRFNAFWKVDKVTRIELSGGQTHVHRINYARNKAFPNEVIQQTDATGGPFNSIKGLSRALMWTQLGEPVKDTGTGSTAGVTTATTEVGVVAEIQYRYSLLNFPSRTITANNTLLTATGQNLTFVNELVDAVQTVAQV